MKLIRSYYTLILLPIPILVGASYLKAKTNNLPSNIKWDLKNYLSNFTNLSQAKPEELKSRICPLHILKITPIVDQKILGAENKKEAEKIVQAWQDIIRVGTGLAIASVPIIRFFSTCLTHAHSGVCTKASIHDLMSYSAIPIMCGAYLLSGIASSILLDPLVRPLTRDIHQPTRIALITQEYTKMLIALQQVLDKPADDPQFKQIATIVEQFLRISPQIENELHDTLSLDRSQAQELLLPLQTVCRQFLIKHSHATVEAAKTAKLLEIEKQRQEMAQKQENESGRIPAVAR